MKALSIFFLLFVNSILSYCYMPSPAYNYEQYSENKKYVFKSFSFSFYPTGIGETKIYEAENLNALYQINEYFDNQTYISNSGKLVSIRKQLVGWEWAKQSLISIYSPQDEPQKLFAIDIINDTSKLNINRTNFNWHKRVFMTNDTVFILTIENTGVLVDVNAGTVHNVPGTDIVSRLRKPAPKLIVNQLPFCPARRGWGTGSLYQDILSLCDRKLTENYSEATMSVYVGIQVMDNNQCKPYFIRISDKDTHRDHTSLRKKIADLISKQEVNYNHEQLFLSKALYYGDCNSVVFEYDFYFE